MHSAFAGEVRFVVENNGEKRIDTGFNKNLILNQGLHFFGGGKGVDMMDYCLVGSGNSEPTITQNKLDICVAGVAGSADSSRYDYTPDSTNTYKCSLTKRYVFTTLAGNNISEVGLASQYSSPGSNYLCTRALVKDASGNPTVLSLISGDTLTIYYRIWAVHSTLDTDQIINMSDGFGGSTQYNVKSRAVEVGKKAEWASTLSKVLIVDQYPATAHNTELVAITNSLKPGFSDFSSASMGVYNNDFTRVAYIKAGTSKANGNIRAIQISSDSFGHKFGWYQIRFGRVSDDTPIAKDNTMELTIPIKFTWGRYEEVL